MNASKSAGGLESSRFALTAVQLRFLDTFGYLRVPGLLRNSIESIGAAFEQVIKDHGGEAYAGEHRLTVSPGINWSDELCRTFLDAPQIEGVLSSVLGADYQFWNTELSLCSGDTPWHSDSAWPAERRMPRWYEILVYLDPLDADNGALRVMPGTHRVDDVYANEFHRGIIDAAECMPIDPGEAWGTTGRNVPAVLLPSEPGDIILLNYMTAHASFDGGVRRRLMTSVFFPRLADSEIDQLRRVIRARGYTKNRLFGKTAPILHAASPRRLLHLEQLLAHTPDTNVSLGKLFGVSSEIA